ncbi:MAG: DNA-binding protein [Planctomycetes bacterium RBG_16_64_10]|nr:MAG: DNA-binding protein [Planctomycetes bacterium RBG_16_64_10]
MKPAVYLETSVIGHLASRLSRDLLTPAHQQLTQQWWETRRPEFDLYVSELVVQEAGGGDPAEAQRWLACLEGVSQLELNDACRRLARDLVDRHAIPQEAVEDAAHIAIAAVHGVDYLLTWNCAHIANAQRRNAIEQVCRDNGYEPPLMCTPEELLGGH